METHFPDVWHETKSRKILRFQRMSWADGGEISMSVTLASLTRRIQVLPMTIDVANTIIQLYSSYAGNQ